MFEDIVKSASQLCPIPAEAAQDHDANKTTLAETVNDAMTAMPNIDELVGRNPLRIMYDNHANHAMFMANVFKLNDFELLARVVPWVYRAYHCRGFSFDYFPAVLHQWQAAVRKHLAASTAETVLPVYGWMISKHREMVELARDKSYITLPADGIWDEQAAPFLEALLTGSRTECMAIATQAAPTTQDLANLYVRIIQPAMYRVGALWETNEISVAQEHLATSLVSRVMAAVYERFESADVSKGKAVVSATPNEQHETGARMVADLLELDGWQVTYLGANTPGGDILDCAVASEAALVALSASMPFNIDKVAELAAEVRNRKTTSPLKIMVGGIAFLGIPRLWESVGADGYAPDAISAVSLANQWWKDLTHA